jgi:hypothetical protein
MTTPETGKQEIIFSEIVFQVIGQYGVSEKALKEDLKKEDVDIFEDKEVNAYKEEILQSLKVNKIDQKRVKRIFLQSNQGIATRMIAVLEDGTDETHIIQSGF